MATYDQAQLEIPFKARMRIEGYQNGRALSWQGVKSLLLYENYQGSIVGGDGPYAFANLTGNVVASCAHNIAFKVVDKSK